MGKNGDGGGGGLLKGTLKRNIQYRHTSFYCAFSHYCASQMLHFFLQIEGKTLHKQKIAIRFIAAVWE